MTELDKVVDQAVWAWPSFKRYMAEAGQFVAAHVLAVTRSHYLKLDLQRVQEGVACETTSAQLQALTARSMPAATVLADKMDLCGETREGSSQP